MEEAPSVLLPSQPGDRTGSRAYRELASSDAALEDLSKCVEGVDGPMIAIAAHRRVTERGCAGARTHGQGPGFVGLTVLGSRPLPSGSRGSLASRCTAPHGLAGANSGAVGRPRGLTWPSALLAFRGGHPASVATRSNPPDSQLIRWTSSDCPVTITMTPADLRSPARTCCRVGPF